MKMIQGIAKFLATMVAVAFLVGLVLGLYMGFKAGAATPAPVAVGMIWIGRG